ncbi:MAG TPA: helix-turn-helix transcriptional regulator [Fimbriimonadaceae bacterium]|nr:helix-turn-helix transcriptional regulator [Fimbriimonadaceae bacterium]
MVQIRGKSVAPATPKDETELRRGGIQALSSREQQVLSYAAAGYLDKQIAAEIGVSLNTLRTYWKRIRAKVGEAARTALAAEYVRQTAGAREEIPAKAEVSPGSVPAVAIPAEPSTDSPFNRAPDWELDLSTDTFRWFADPPPGMDLTSNGSVPVEERLSYFHPEDVPRIRGLILSAKSGALSEFMFSGRLVTAEGTYIAAAVARVVADGSGHPIKLQGWRVGSPLETTRKKVVAVGNWSYDSFTHTFKLDSGFRSLFRVRGSASALWEQTLGRFHPEDAAFGAAILSGAAALDRRRFRAACRLKAEDGSEQWVVLSIVIDSVREKGHTVHGTVIAC